MGVSESARDLQRDRKRFIERETAAVEARLQRFAIVERHRDEQLSVLGFPDLVDRADARVIEGGGGARFRDELRLGVRVGTQVRRKKLQRDVTAEPLVPRSVHDRHAAGAERILHHVVTDPAARPFHRRLRQPRAGWLDERAKPIDDALAVVGDQQRLHFATERRIAGAAGVEERRPPGSRAVDRVSQDVVHALPALGRHGVGRTAHACSSRFSHARAVAHSRLTVAVETFSVSAVSSTLIPPKNRYSTICA